MRAALSFVQRWLYGFAGFAGVIIAFVIAMAIAIAGPPGPSEAGVSFAALQQFVCEEAPNPVRAAVGCAAEPARTQTVDAAPEPSPVQIAQAEPKPEPAIEPSSSEAAPARGAELEGGPAAQPRRATRARETPPRRTARAQTTERRATRPTRRAAAPTRTTRQRTAPAPATIPHVAHARADTLPPAELEELQEARETTTQPLVQPEEPEPDIVGDWRRQAWRRGEGGPRHDRARSDREDYRRDEYAQADAEDPHLEEEEDIYEDESSPKEYEDEYYEDRPRRRWRRRY